MNHTRTVRIVMVIRLAAAMFVAGLVLTGCRDTGLGMAGDPAPTGAVAIPDVAGERLSTAREELSARGFRNVSVHDATGRDRPVIVARDWIVRSQAPAPGTRGGARTRITLTVSRPTDGVGPTRTTVGVVPDVVCTDLRRAEEEMRADGFDNLDSRDGTGRGRAQLVDRNWVVTAQSARAGSRPAAGTRIVLTAVKFGEPTGDSGCRS